MTPVPPPPVEVILARAFAPMHKRVLGVAIGITAAAFVFAVTAFHVIARPPEALPLELLANYFYGYSVSWQGALAGAWWAFVAGFAAGWFAAFLRNFVLATWLLIIKAKADLTQTEDFLDHI